MCFKHKKRERVSATQSIFVLPDICQPLSKQKYSFVLYISSGCLWFCPARCKAQLALTSQTANAF